MWQFFIFFFFFSLKTGVKGKCRLTPMGMATAICLQRKLTEPHALSGSSPVEKPQQSEILPQKAKQVSPGPLSIVEGVMTPSQSGIERPAKQQCVSLTLRYRYPR